MNTVQDSPGKFSLLLEEEAVQGGIMARSALIVSPVNSEIPLGASPKSAVYNQGQLVYY